MTEIEDLKRKVEIAKLALECIALMTDKATVEGFANSMWSEINEKHKGQAPELIGAAEGDTRTKPKGITLYEFEASWGSVWMEDEVKEVFTIKTGRTLTGDAS